jgi:hypothetical protein
VAYAGFHASGRLSFPWCRKGHEALAEPLLERVLEEMRSRGCTTAWAAYRADWTPQRDFFLAHGFGQPREIINYVLDLVEMPTPAARVATTIAPLQPADVPALLSIAPNLLRLRTREALARHLLSNAWFPPDSVFVLRSRQDNQPLAAGVMIANPTFAHPKQVDSAMPCFRLGAFGTEGLSAKRINGLFSVLVGEDRNVSLMALDLLGYAAMRLETTEVETVAAQVASDVPHLVRFYKQYFRRQGAFPIFERAL